MGALLVAGLCFFLAGNNTIRGATTNVSWIASSPADYSVAADWDKGFVPGLGGPGPSYVVLFTNNVACNYFSNSVAVLDTNWIGQMSVGAWDNSAGTFAMNGGTLLVSNNLNDYAVTIRVNIDKSYRDDKGDYAAATGMKDYIEIGVLGADVKDSSGRTVKRFLHRKKYWLTQGEHTMTITVAGEPKAVAVDPLGMLIDPNEGDNYKNIE